MKLGFSAEDEAFRAVSLRRLLTGKSDPQDTSEL